MDKRERKVATIRYLLNTEKLPNKVVRLIMFPCSQSWVSKIGHNNLHKTTTPAALFNPVEFSRYNTLQKIYSLSSLPTTTIDTTAETKKKKRTISANEVDEEDKRYIHLLKYLLIPIDKIWTTLYPNVSRNGFENILSDKTINFYDFNSNLIGVSLKDYGELLSNIV